MDSIDNAWLIPLSKGGIYKIIFCSYELKIIRIFSGKYIDGELKLRKGIKYMDSLTIPTATDPLEPEELYNNIKNMVNYITDEYNKEEENKSKDSNDIKIIKYNDIKNIKLKKGDSEELPELIINDDKFILPHKDFDKGPEMGDDLYNKYDELIKKYIKR